MGRATADRFAREGYRVVLAARNTARLSAQAQELQNEGHSVEIKQVDASDPKQVASLVRSIGPALAVMHYNAAVLHYDAVGNLQTRTLEQETVEGLTTEMNINVTSALAAMQAAEEVMTARGEGSILITGGGFEIEPTGDFLNISVAKAALRAATKALFEPMRDKGIHIATVTVSTLVAVRIGSVRRVRRCVAPRGRSGCCSRRAPR